MRKCCLLSVLALMAVIMPSPSVSGRDFFTDYFSSLNLTKSDPGAPDTVYLEYELINAYQQVIRIRLKTDNVSSGDSILGIIIPLMITTTRPGVTLDTTTATTYAGTAVFPWQFLVNLVRTNGGDPSAFPMQVLIGGLDSLRFGYLPVHPLGAGNHLLATLVFSTPGPSQICADSTRDVSSPGLILATSAAVEYVPYWGGRVCSPVIPTLSQWGLIAFGVLLLGSLIFYLRRSRIRPA